MIETNFYNGGGSKLNEVARAYSDVAPKINQYSGYEFVWITDGQGWLSARNKLEEAYSIIPSVYNLTTLNIFIQKIKKENIPDYLCFKSCDNEIKYPITVSEDEDFIHIVFVFQ